MTDRSPRSDVMSTKTTCGATTASCRPTSNKHVIDPFVEAGGDPESRRRFPGVKRVYVEAATDERHELEMTRRRI